MAFPTSPVSPDAVLLMTAHVVAAFAGGGLGRMLVQGVARDLTKRGIRAIEAFGDAKFGDGRTTPTGGCLAPADFFLSVGLQDGAPASALPAAAAGAAHRAVWKSDVEYALEKLLGSMSPETLLRPVRPAPATRSTPADAREPAAQSTTRAGGHHRPQLADVDRAGRHVRLDREVHPLHRGDDRLDDPLAEQRVDQPRPVHRRGQVADVDPYRGHPGQPQQLPGLGVGVAVAQPGAGDDLALHQPGQPLAHRRGDAVVGAVVVGRDARRRPGWRARRGAAR